jgi:TonB family protein
MTQPHPVPVIYPFNPYQGETHGKTPNHPCLLPVNGRGWSGQVEISFTITPDGSIRDLRILTSSGYSLLDDEALTAIRQTAPFTPPPQVAAALTMPITFRIN